MTFGLACDRDGYDLRILPCPECGSRGCNTLGYPEICRQLRIEKRRERYWQQIEDDRD